MDDLREILDRMPKGYSAEIHKDQNGEFTLIVPDGNEQDPDADAYFIEGIEGRVQYPGGE